MPYYKGVLGDYVVEADSHDEANKAIDRRILAGIVPILDVMEVEMDPSEAEDYGTLEEPEGPWVAVEVYGLIVQDVHIFWKEEEAIAWWENYTGLKYGTLYDEDGNCVNDDYDQTKIFTKGTHVPSLENFEKLEGIVILPPFYSKVMRNKWLQALKTKLGGIKLLVSQNLIARDGPPGFEIVYATDIAWIVCWKPYEDEDEDAVKEWNQSLPVDVESALKAGAIDLRG